MDEVKKLTNEELIAEFILVRQHLIEIRMEMFRSGKDKFSEKMLSIETTNYNNLYKEIMERMKK